MSMLARLSFVLLLCLPAVPVRAQEAVTFALGADGRLPAWLVAGPFDQPIVGFGTVQDHDAIGEAAARPSEGEAAASAVVAGGTVAWKPVSPRADGLVDFHEALGWALPDAGPEKVWWAKAGYAVTYVESPSARDALLLLGSNTDAKVLLNGETVHQVPGDRNAVPDADAVALRLRAGRNTLLVKVGQNHRNEGPTFFGERAWGWGFYARLVAPDRTPLGGVQVALPVRRAATGVDVVSTFYFREAADGLAQRFDLVLTSRRPEGQDGTVEVRAGGRTWTFPLAAVPFGESRHPLYLPAVDAPTQARVVVRLGREVVRQAAVLRPQPRYELHLMLLSHNDIGYTNPQPVVRERQVQTLDDVLALAEADPDFRWTIETVWQLEQFEQSRPRAVFERLMALVREGRVALSPLYTNPYTGWVSSEELVRSLAPAQDYAARYGLSYRAAVYDDVPGFSWLLPQVLHGAGVTFLAAGLNELFNDYAFQRALPKVFYWEGTGGHRVLTYRTEAYNEGQTYGMVYGPEAMVYRMWPRLHRLAAQGYPYELVLVNTTFGDNGGIARFAYESARRWNAQYAYPKVVTSTIDRFAGAFEARYGAADLPVVRGDWTSSWDVLYQGEPARMVRQRLAQHRLLSAEKLATLAWLRDPEQVPPTASIEAGYRSLLHYSGHGSGLEYGYGSPADNDATMAYREGYVQDALLAADDALLRATFRLVHPEEAFDGEGIFVSNPLSWARDAPVEVQFTSEAAAPYHVIDLATGDTLPAYQHGFDLRFVARGLPALGYRKYRLQPAGPVPPAPARGGSLQVGTASIENAFYRIEADPATGALTRITDRKTGRELVDAGSPHPFGVPLVARALDGHDFAPVAAAEVRVTVRDERPARVVLVVERPGHLVPRAAYALWEGVDRVDARYDVDLTVLAAPPSVEEYGVAFPFAGAGDEAALEVAGGFLDPDRDRLPGVDHRVFSLRRSAALLGADHRVDWAAVDSRVVRLLPSEGRGDVLVANLVNNFPAGWNRQEENAGTWPFRFQFAGREGGRADAATGRFGWEAATPPVVYRTWLRADPPTDRLFAVDGDSVAVLTMKPSADGTAVLLRLMNLDSRHPATARLTAPAAAEVRRVSFLEAPGALLDASGDAAGGTFTLTLAPGEIATVRIPVRQATASP